jgi:hypothetical protein
MKKENPTIPIDGNLRAVSLQVELDPISKEDLPISVIQVLPLNEVEIRDMRENFKVTELSVLSILSHFGTQSLDLAIDYDHGMWTGENPLAAGWGEKIWAVVPEEWHGRIEPFVSQYGERVGIATSEDEAMWGVYVFVRWTENAAELIRSREYRYVSPVIFFSYTGEANYLWNAAIVNNPAIDGMDALAAAAMPPSGGIIDNVVDDLSSADDGSAPIAEEHSSTIEEERKGEAEMPNLKKLVDLFNLDVDTEAEDFDAEAFEVTFEESVEAMKVKANESEELAAQVEQVNSELSETKESLAEANEALATINEEKEKAEAEVRLSKIDAAIEAGQLAESQRDWAVKHFDSFEELLPTLEEDPQGPRQGKTVDAEKEEEALSTGSDRLAERDRIAAYAKENDISFKEAFTKLGQETE